MIFRATQSYKGVVASAAMMRAPVAAMIVALIETTSMGSLRWTAEDFRSGDDPRILSAETYSDKPESAEALRWK